MHDSELRSEFREAMNNAEASVALRDARAEDRMMRALAVEHALEARERELSERLYAFEEREQRAQGEASRMRSEQNALEAHTEHITQQLTGRANELEREVIELRARRSETIASPAPTSHAGSLTSFEQNPSDRARERQDTIRRVRDANYNPLRFMRSIRRKRPPLLRILRQ